MYMFIYLICLYIYIYIYTENYTRFQGKIRSPSGRQRRPFEIVVFDPAFRPLSGGTGQSSVTHAGPRVGATRRGRVGVAGVVMCQVRRNVPIAPQCADCVAMRQLRRNAPMATRLAEARREESIRTRSHGAVGAVVSSCGTAVCPCTQVAHVPSPPLRLLIVGQKKKHFFQAVKRRLSAPSSAFSTELRANSTEAVLEFLIGSPLRAQGASLTAGAPARRRSSQRKLSQRRFRAPPGRSRRRRSRVDSWRPHARLASPRQGFGASPIRTPRDRTGGVGFAHRLGGFGRRRLGHRRGVGDPSRRRPGGGRTLRALSDSPPSKTARRVWTAPKSRCRPSAGGRRANPAAGGRPPARTRAPRTSDFYVRSKSEAKRRLFTAACRDRPPNGGPLRRDRFWSRFARTGGALKSGWSRRCRWRRVATPLPPPPPSRRSARVFRGSERARKGAVARADRRRALEAPCVREGGGGERVRRRALGASGAGP